MDNNWSILGQVLPMDETLYYGAMVQSDGSMFWQYIYLELQLNYSQCGRHSKHRQIVLRISGWTESVDGGNRST